MNNKHFNTKRYSHIPNSEGSNSFPINRANSLNTFRGQISSRQNETSSSTLNQSGTALNILKEVIQINEILGDLKKNDWKVRIEKIDRLKFCMMQVANAYEDDNEMKNI